MTTSFTLRRGALAGSMLVALALAGPGALAAEPGTAPLSRATQPDPRAGVPRAPAGSPPQTGRYGDPAHPNLSGIWQMAGPGNMAESETIPWSPAYAAKMEYYRKMAAAGTPVADSVTRCLAMGMPKFMTIIFELVQAPEEIVMTAWALTDFRRIYIDGRGHSKDFDPDFNGDSVGHWEGDELVIDTNNFVPNVIETLGTSFSDKLHVVERLRRVSPTVMEISTTLTDPEALTQPFKFKRTYDLIREGHRLEMSRCTNNRETIGPDGLIH